jgi:hypothetical protein
MAQREFSFKLGVTDEAVTANAGLAMFGEFMHRTGVLSAVDSLLKGPGSAVGYKPSQYVEPLLLMLQGGGRTLEDLRVIRNDSALLKLLRIDSVPSADAVGDWLRRQGKAHQGLSGLWMPSGASSLRAPWSRARLTRPTRLT